MQSWLHVEEGPYLSSIGINNSQIQGRCWLLGDLPDSTISVLHALPAPILTLNLYQLHRAQVPELLHHQPSTSITDQQFEVLALNIVAPCMVALDQDSLMAHRSMK